MPADLGRFMPRIYDGIYEIDQIIATENVAFDNFNAAMERVYKNQYILTADEDGIKDFEKVYGITANPETEDLEFRRQRVLGRASLTLPFSMRFLRQRLDEIIGAGKYQMTVNYEARELRIESAVKDANWYHETNILIGKIKPCNMVYVNNPYAEYAVTMNEEISVAELIYNYRLGTTWVLGQKPFGDHQELGVIKMAEVPTIKDALLADIAAYTASDIDNVLINDMLEITEFEIKSANANLSTIAYSLPDQAVREITNIKLRKGDTVLCESSVYVPVMSQVDIKHNILIKEGV